MLRGRRQSSAYMERPRLPSGRTCGAGNPQAVTYDHAPRITRGPRCPTSVSITKRPGVGLHASDRFGWFELRAYLLWRSLNGYCQFCGLSGCLGWESVDWSSVDDVE